MKEENSERLGRLADTIENIIAALTIPMPDEFHLRQVKSFLPDWAKELKEIHTDETGENPWQ